MEPLTFLDLADLFVVVSVALGSMICFALGFIGGVIR